MSKMTIRLNSHDIKALIREVEDLRKQVTSGCERLRELLAESISTEAEAGFNGVILDDTFRTIEGKGNSKSISNVNPIMSDGISVSYRAEGDNVTVVFTQNEDAIWIEFGAGVHHNGAKGSRPNPLAGNVPEVVGIGEYGHGKGSRDSWVFVEDGTRYQTHGTPASMPMYHALQNTLADFPSIVRSVFPNARL